MSERYIRIYLSPESLPGLSFKGIAFKKFLSHLQESIAQSLELNGFAGTPISVLERMRGPLEITLSSSQHQLPGVSTIDRYLTKAIEEYRLSQQHQSSSQQDAAS